jgi:hypothetical protein
VKTHVNGVLMEHKECEKYKKQSKNTNMQTILDSMAFTKANASEEGIFQVTDRTCG